MPDEETPPVIPHTGTDSYLNLSIYMRILLRRQHANDRRSFPPIWYWRLHVEDTYLSKLYGQKSQSLRRYEGPFPLLGYVDQQKWKRHHRKEGTEEQWDDFALKISEAERLRLAEAVLPDDPALWNNFRLQAGDLFEFHGRLFQLESFDPENYYGPTSQIVVWRSGSSKFRWDSASDPPVEIPSDRPQVGQWPRYLS